MWVLIFNTGQGLFKVIVEKKRKLTFIHPRESREGASTRARE